MNDNNDNVIDLKKFRIDKQKEVMDDVDKIIAEEELLKLVSQMSAIDNECKKFWSLLTPNQKMMALYVVTHNIFQSVVIDDAEGPVENVVQGYLGIPIDNPGFAAVLDASCFDVVWDLLMSGKEIFNNPTDEGA